MPRAMYICPVCHKNVLASKAIHIKTRYYHKACLDKKIKKEKEKIDNDVFHEWCDALLLCQQDRGLKTTLSPIVAKLSDIRVVNSELELLLAEPRKEFIIMAILVAANIPIMYFLNKDWYNVLMHTAVGKMVLALDISAIFISSAFVVKLTRPIEFRR